MPLIHEAEFSVTARIKDDPATASKQIQTDVTREHCRRQKYSSNMHFFSEMSLSRNPLSSPSHLIEDTSSLVRRLFRLTLTGSSVRAEGESGSASTHTRIFCARKVLLAAMIPISARIHLCRFKKKHPTEMTNTAVNIWSGEENLGELLLHVFPSGLSTKPVLHLHTQEPSVFTNSCSQP